MIFHLDDIMEDVYKEFDQIEKSSLNKICKTGLVKMRSHLSKRNELRLSGDRNRIKFFIPMTPEVQSEHASYKLWRKTVKNEETDSK